MTLHRSKPWLAPDPMYREVLGEIPFIDAARLDPSHECVLSLLNPLQMPFRPFGILSRSAVDGLMLMSIVCLRSEQLEAPPFPLLPIVQETEKARIARRAGGPLQLPSMPPGAQVTLRVSNVGTAPTAVRLSLYGVSLT
jgi:hypothetical protein